MNFEVITTPDFEKSFKPLAKRHRSLKADIRDFIEGLKQNPFQGDELTSGIRKIRMAITSKGRGKSGGARVITYTVVALDDSGEVYLLDIYDKNDFSTVDVPTLQKIVKDLNVASGLRTRSHTAPADTACRYSILLPPHPSPNLQPIVKKVAGFNKNHYLCESIVKKPINEIISAEEGWSHLFQQQ